MSLHFHGQVAIPYFLLNMKKKSNHMLDYTCLLPVIQRTWPTRKEEQYKKMSEQQKKMKEISAANKREAALKCRERKKQLKELVANG